MSTGGTLPYQLRPNKAVERLIFVDLLRRLDVPLRINANYKYFGFGGPQMEDFRLLNECFPDMKMVSVERDENVWKRQRFNGPHTNVRCKRQCSNDFVSGFSCKSKVVVWLDYTMPSERTTQVFEFQTILKRVRELSVVKVTLNANSATLGGKGEHPNLATARLKTFLDQFSRCFPNGLEEEAVSGSGFPITLLRVLEYLSSEALHDRSDWRFQPLASAVYADGQKMLTLTGLVGKREDLIKISGHRNLQDWGFARFDWKNPLVIEVPELTMKERIHVNQLLPKHERNIGFIQRKLGFPVASDPDENERQLRNYVSFQRHYPHFGKVTI